MRQIRSLGQAVTYTPPPGAILLAPKVLSTFFNRDGTWRASRYKVLYGGRGSAKSRGIASVAVGRMRAGRELILCTRENQNSIADSVHRLLANEVERQGMMHEFDIQRDKIINLRTQAEAIFKGLRHNAQEIKSTEGITIAWLGEARATSKESLQILLPTIRAPGSEIWMDLNPELSDDPVYEEFIADPRPGSVVTKLNWSDNPYFPPELDAERRADLSRDPEAYDWIWEGHTRRRSKAQIFTRWVEEAFTEPTDTRPYIGLDFGLGGDDPSAVNRCYIYRDPSPEQPLADSLFITHEAHGVKVELDDIAVLALGGKLPDGRVYPGIPGADKWPIKCDASQPGIISMLRRGLNGRTSLTASAAEKWPGSVDDGIAHLKAFRRIVIHPRCTHTLQEARLYSYKVDKRTGDVLPVVEDKWNHHWDAIRYSLDGVIQRAGVSKWVKMAGGRA